MIKNLYRFVLEAQEFSNLGGVARSFSEVVEAIQAEEPPAGVLRKDQLRGHPAYLLYLDKLLSLTAHGPNCGLSIGTELYAEAYAECLKRADAEFEAVKVPVPFARDEGGTPPKVGDRVVYLSGMYRSVEGWVADATPSPLSGTAHIRVVDFWHEAKDQDAGRWVNVALVREVNGKAVAA